MRILSISGQNIASLAERFEIDFTAAPLHGAGLFAITGETGAGKSSILDAMCLALYGDAPRLAAGASGDEVPDPSGDTIKAKDTRAILRRGAVQAWAEVRFAARDGQEYLARWQARRARDKADGKLQHVARSLARAFDRQVLASQTTAVNEQIITLTGLTYEEFRRTVLLAQGDFDAFLRADTNERAELLEKVTGTSLYRAVSCRVYDRTEAVRQRQLALTQQRGAHRLLSEAEQGGLIEEREALAAENAGAVAKRDVRVADLDCHMRHAEATRHVRQAEVVEAEAEAALGSAAPDRERLSLLDRVEPLRPLWLRRHEAAARVARASAALAAQLNGHAEAEDHAAKLQQAADRASADLAQKEAEFKSLGPQWDEAATLDAQITSAESECATARWAAEAAASEAKAAETDVAALQAAAREAEALLTTTAAEMVRLAPAAPLADRWEHLRLDLVAHGAAVTQAHAATAEAQGAAEKLGVLQAEDLALAAALVEMQGRDAAWQAEAQAISRQVAALDLQHPPQVSRQLADLAAALGALHRAGEDHEAAQHALTLALDQEQAGQAGANVARAAIAAAAQALTAAEAMAAALAAPSQQADLALSETARALRLHLEPGQPCPVCGAAEHPIHDNAALAELARGLRAELANARQAAQTARESQMAAERACAQHEAQVMQAQASARTAGASRAKAASDWAAAWHKAQPIPGCPAGLSDRPSADLEGIVAAQGRIAASQEVEAEAQLALAGLRKRLQDIASHRENMQASLQERITEREAIRRGQAEAEQLLGLAQQAAQNHKTIAERHLAAIAPVLQGVGALDDAIEAALPTAGPLGQAGGHGTVALDDPRVMARLATLVEQVAKARQAHKSAQEMLVDLAPRLSGQASRAEALAERARQSAQDAQARALTLDSLQQKRAVLLGGEPTSAHRTRFNEGRKAALTAWDQAQKASAEAMTRAVAALTQYQAAGAEQAAAHAALASVEADLAEETAELGLADLEVQPLFQHGREAVQALRDHLRSLDDALLAARAAVHQRRCDLDALQQVLPEGTAEEMRAEIVLLDAAILQRQLRLGAIENQFAADAATRRQLAGLEAEIATVTAELEVWQAVNTAVGSRNGDRFARFAQSITLDVLAETANRHLADLNPRYRLRRAADLALQVEDIDMGGEARATRSLSGGERFLVSLALALALSRMGGKGGLAATLFIDEGFGSLDATSLDLAINALEALQSQGRQVGVISHVEAMKDRIPVRILVSKQGGGRSTVRLSGGGDAKG